MDVRIKIKKVFNPKSHKAENCTELKPLDIPISNIWSFAFDWGLFDGGKGGKTQ